MEIIMSETFQRWLDGLADLKGKTRIQARIDRMAVTGSPGDCKALKGEDGLFEMRVDVGPGYRVYFIRRGLVTVVLPAGESGAPSASRASAVSGIASWPMPMRFQKLSFFLFKLRPSSRDGFHDVCLRQLVPRQLAYDIPVPHDDQP